MPNYLITYEKTDMREFAVEAESPSAARQAWIDDDHDTDVLIEFVGATIVDFALAANDGKPLPFLRSPGPMFPDITVQLTDKGGDAYEIVGRVGGLIEKHVDAEASLAFREMALACVDSYDELLRVVMTFVRVA